MDEEVMKKVKVALIHPKLEYKAVQWFTLQQKQVNQIKRQKTTS